MNMEENVLAMSNRFKGILVLPPVCNVLLSPRFRYTSGDSGPMKNAKNRTGTGAEVR